jgi:hypothetical protein
MHPHLQQPYCQVFAQTQKEADLVQRYELHAICEHGYQYDLSVFPTSWAIDQKWDSSYSGHSVHGMTARGHMCGIRLV